MKIQEDHRLLRGRDIRARILKNVTAAVDAEGVVGRIVSIMIGNTPEVAVYIRGQARAANVVGIRFDEQVWSETITQDDCKNRIQEMNNDPDVLGIILQRPVPSHINVRSLQSAIHP
jgi:methylenetetrahydrofolate dehydrogenase (NADP+)/methenyltetrahydrofolate cyclohydrolase